MLDKIGDNIEKVIFEGHL